MPGKATYTTIMSKDIQGYSAERNNYRVNAIKATKWKQAHPSLQKLEPWGWSDGGKNRQFLRLFLPPPPPVEPVTYTRGRAGDGMVAITPSLLWWGPMPPFAVTPMFSDKPSFPAKIFHSWIQFKGEFILESLSQVFLQLRVSSRWKKGCYFPPHKIMSCDYSNSSGP